jgi:hypothetical protein
MTGARPTRAAASNWAVRATTPVFSAIAEKVGANFPSPETMSRCQCKAKNAVRVWSSSNVTPSIPINRLRAGD